MFLDQITKIISWWVIHLQSLKISENWVLSQFFDVFGVRNMENQADYQKFEIYMKFRVDSHYYFFEISVTAEHFFSTESCKKNFFSICYFLNIPIDREFNSEQLLFLDPVTKIISWWVIHLQSRKMSENCDFAVSRSFWVGNLKSQAGCIEFIIYTKFWAKLSG